MYDVERFGIINTGNPKHADVFLITGSVNEQCKDIVKQIYDQMPDPKIVVAVGICANSGGVFAECYNVLGGVDKVIPVDIYVPGCAARPEAIIDGVVKGLGVLAEKRQNMLKAPKTGVVAELETVIAEVESMIAEVEAKVETTEAAPKPLTLEELTADEPVKETAAEEGGNEDER